VVAVDRVDVKKPEELAPSPAGAVTSTDESANGVPSEVAPHGAATADDYLKQEETE
jgi:hypothetical protein